jgi:hypothetical protein
MQQALIRYPTAAVEAELVPVADLGAYANLRNRQFSQLIRAELRQVDLGSETFHRHRSSGSLL